MASTRVKQSDPFDSSFRLSMRVNRALYAEFETLCHARSIEVGDAVRAMLQQLVAAGTLEGLLTADERGYMPGGLIADMRRGMDWQPKKRGRPRKARPPG